MTAPKWQAGKLYLPGDIVQPVTTPKPTAAQVANGSFEDGSTGWDFTGAVVFDTGGGYSGPNNCRIPGVPGAPVEGVALNQTKLVVDTGKSLTARCMIHQGASDVDHTRGWVEVHWFDADDLWLKTDAGNVINDGRGGAWHQSSVVSTRPANAAYARAGIALWQDSQDEVNGDYLTVSGAQSALPEGLVYKAVQPEAGTSGASEPAWPSVLGVQVNDNEVIWEAVATNRVTWTAKPRYVSGDNEPDWPAQVGGFVQDGTINWKAISRRVEDEKCPNSKVVAIIASKVFAADRDIVRFSATLNPLDWSSEQDAGFLGTGLQQANSNNMTVLNQYRSNLVAFNASCFQNWQADPDPAAMALLDQMDGIGSTWQQAATSVGNELFYLSQLGVRTIGIANAAENLAAGDVGSPIDPLVREAIRVATANGSKIHSTYYPGAGQYWLAFPDYPPNPLAISGDLPDGYVDIAGTYQYTASGGVMPYGDFTISAGALPPGTTMDASGMVTYDYTTAGSYSWTVSVTDADGNVATLDDSASISTFPALSPTGASVYQQTDPAPHDWIVPLPPGLTAGDLIILQVTGGRILSGGNYVSVDTPSGFTKIAGTGWVAPSSAGVDYGLFYRIADGSEGESITASVTYGGGTTTFLGGHSAQALRVPAGDFDPLTPPEAVFAAPVGATTTVQWPEASPSWGSSPSLVLALSGEAYTSTLRTPDTLPLPNGQAYEVPPSTGGGATRVGQCHGTGSSASIAPGSATFASAFGAEQIVAATLVVKV